MREGVRKPAAAVPGCRDLTSSNPDLMKGAVFPITEHIGMAYQLLATYTATVKLPRASPAGQNRKHNLGFYCGCTLSMRRTVCQCASICHMAQTAFGQAISWPFLNVSKANYHDGYGRSGNLEQEGVR